MTKSGSATKPAKKERSGLRSAVVAMGAITAILLAITIRALLAAQPHSGYQKPPLHGDFEAQRHWVELTNALPLQDWYRQTPQNDLQYWGLDYPPITAFHSWLIGQVTQKVFDVALGDKEASSAMYESVFGLKVSRGSEGPVTIAVMQGSVMISEAIIYIPAVYFFLSQLHHGMKDRGSASRSFWFSMLLFMFPLPLVFIDYGHFQYNTVSLGLMIWSFGFGLKAMRLETQNKPWSRVLGSTCCSILSIMASILFKQMSLYFALPCGGFYLGMCIRYGRFSNPRSNVIVKFIKFILCFLLFAITGVGFAALIFLPLFNVDAHLNVIERMFPFGRGLYEDKVANFWCSVSPVFKLHSAVVNNLQIIAPKLTPDAFLSLEHEEQQGIVRSIMAGLCAFITLMGSLPAIVGSAMYLAVSKCHTEANAEDSEEDAVAIGLPQPAREQRFFLRGAEVFAACIFAGSMSFYLFSYQVHEKSILLPSTGALLLCAARFARHASFQDAAATASEAPTVAPKPYAALQDPIVAAFIHLGITIALYSLFPLAVKDKLVAAYAIMIVFSAGVSQGLASSVASTGLFGRLVSIAIGLSCIGLMCTHIFYSRYVPPERYPDINTMVMTIYAGVHFFLYFLVVNIMAITEIPFSVVVQREVKTKTE